MKMRQKARGLIPGRHDYTPPARTAEDDRYLLNWLSTRVTPDGLDCAPDSEYERALVENRLAYAQALGLQVRPGAYLPPGSLTHTPQQLAFGDFLAQRSRKRAS
jgi:hypothetical protein